MTNRNTLVTAAVLLTVFFAGALVGAAVASTVTSAADARTAAAANGGTADGAEGEGETPRTGKPGDEAGRHADGDDDHDGRRRGPDYAVSRLLHEELDLDADQERRVEAVLERRRERAHEIFDETKARLRSQFDSTVDELEQVLTDEQAARFDTLLDRLKERRGWDEEGPEDDAAPPGDDRR